MQKDNVVPRKSIIGNIFKSSRTLYRESVKQNMERDFYNYSFALQSYMYNKRYDMFDKIHDLIRKNDVTAYDAPLCFK